MNLTQAHIPYDIAARQWKGGGFRDSYAWHKRVWEAFPGQPDAKRSFLTRLDDTGQDFRLLILSSESPIRPDWCPVDQWQTKVVNDAFFQHPAYQFSLLANPTRKQVIRDENGVRKKNGRRVALVQREDLLAWIERKASEHGFQVDSATLKTVPRPRQHFLKASSGGTHTATEFVGTLRVTNPASFKEAATHGIGSAKAFGFGLLCLAPLNH